MSLRDAVLVALLEGESSGYDLAKDFDASVANFWMATPQQLYRELERLSEQGLIQARIVEQERRPNKRMFSLTDAGYEEIRQFTGRPPKPSAIRDELLVKVQALDVGDTAAVRDLIVERRDRAEAKAINRAMGTHAPAVYAPKAALGHSVGAVGAVESILTVLALRDGVIPPTLNLRKLDPEIDLDVVTGEPRTGDYQYAVNNSFAFGGYNVALAFGNY